MTDLLLKQLASDFELSERAVLILDRSVQKSKHLLASNTNLPLTEDQRETLEALTSRFGRALDLLTQKLLRTIDKIELTDDGSVLDRVNRFKKRGVLREEINYGIIKDIRNQIVHEYFIDESDQIVQDVLKYSPIVIEIYERSKAYCKARKFF